MVIRDSAETDVMDAIQVRSWVHPLQLGARGREGIKFHQCVTEPGTSDPVEHRIQPLRPFGGTRTGPKFGEGGGVWMCE